jgi:hypothetical protein
MCAEELEQKHDIERILGSVDHLLDIRNYLRLTEEGKKERTVDPIIGGFYILNLSNEERAELDSEIKKIFERIEDSDYDESKIEESGAKVRGIIDDLDKLYSRFNKRKTETKNEKPPVRVDVTQNVGLDLAAVQEAIRNARIEKPDEASIPTQELPAVKVKKRSLLDIILRRNRG